MDTYFFGAPYAVSEDKIVCLLRFIGRASFSQFPSLPRLSEACSEAAYLTQLIVQLRTKTLYMEAMIAVNELSSICEEGYSSCSLLCNNVISC